MICENELREKLIVRTATELENAEIPEIEFCKTRTQLDELCGGFPMKSISVFAGSSGQGKSFALLHTAVALSCQYKVLYISVENALQVDRARLDGLFEKYRCEDRKDNFKYINIPECDISYKDAINLISLSVDMGNYNCLVIDGGDILVSGDDGGQQYENGNKVMRFLKMLSEKYNLALLLSWQLGRGSVNKKLEDITTDDIATSMGVARYASQMCAVKNNKKEHTWQLRFFKSRFEYSDDSISVLGEDGQFFLNGIYPITRIGVVEEFKQFVREERAKNLSFFD